MIKPHILIVDDQKGPRESLRAILRDLYDTTLAEDGPPAIKLLESKRFDVVLLDKMMPSCDGLDVLSEIRRRWPGVQVIMISADNAYDTIIQATKRQAFYYIVKPFDVEQVRNTVAKAIEERNLKDELARRRREGTEHFRFGNLIGNSAPMKRLFEMIEHVAKSEATALLHGESGTGKELVARAIHDRSARQQGPYIPVHCAAIAKDLLESELFGHEKGAFTGALTQRIGMFEAANGGTLFLDEIGEMDIGLQSKLLRAIQEREIRRVGGNTTVKVNVRIVCATNRNLEVEVAEKRFREDLFYRINVVPIKLPPLRERKEDIPLLVTHFTERFCQELQKPQKQFAPESLDMMANYGWPGNVRELQHCIERLMVVVDAEKILPEHLEPILSGRPAFVAAPPDSDEAVAATPKLVIPEDAKSLEEIVNEIERQAIVQALAQSKGVITEAAAKLGTTRRILRYKMDKLGIAAAADDEKQGELQAT
jgi:DNA-binding NtrC family response regulator